jgi:UDP-2-acetamido-3-amino-2,3-dideoxy-glucuronate N-acetyltransferase
LKPSGHDTAGVILAGAGYWGKNLARNFHDLGALRAIVDSNGAVLEERRSQYPDVIMYKDFEAALDEVDAHAVAIATPASLHYSMARRALDAGKDVYVEKPLSLTTQEGAALVELAEQKGLMLFVGHVLHYHAGIRKMKRMMDEGTIGKLQYIYSNRLNLGKIRRVENILWSFAPHDISIILSLTGEDPDFVQAVGNNFLHAKIADTTMTNLKFPSGVGAHIFVSWLHPFKEQRLVVVGSEGMLVFEDTMPNDQKVTLYPHRIDWRRGMPVPHKMEGRPVPLEGEWEEPLRAECAAFLRCVQHRETPLTDGREGLRVLAVLQACQESLENTMTGGRRFSGTENGVAAIPYDSIAPDNHYYAHETTFIDEGVKIGSGTKIWHFSHVLKDSTIGENCSIGQNVVIGPGGRVGDRCKIQNNVCVYEGVTLEDEVFCGPSMVFTNVINPRSAIPRMTELKRTHVCQGATIGANATIICGTRLGRYCFVGAGAVVVRDVPDYALVVGNPADIIGWMCACGMKLDMSSGRCACQACGKKYILENGLVQPEPEARH